MGKLVTVCMSAIITGDEVSEVMSQAAATSCIQVPTFDASEAIHRARNNGWRNGLQTDTVIASDCKLFVNSEIACRETITERFPVGAQASCHPAGSPRDADKT
jgi:hypothetical protein